MGMKHVIQQLHYYFLCASGLPCKKEAQDFVNRKKLEEKPPKLNPPVCSKAEQQQENLTKCELLLCAVFFTSLPGMGPWRWPITGIFTTCCHCPGQGAHGHSGLWPSEACSAKLVSRWISPSSPLLPPRLQKGLSTLPHDSPSYSWTPLFLERTPIFLQAKRSCPLNHFLLAMTPLGHPLLDAASLSLSL